MYPLTSFISKPDFPLPTPCRHCGTADSAWKAVASSHPWARGLRQAQAERGRAMRRVPACLAPSANRQLSILLPMYGKCDTLM